MTRELLKLARQYRRQASMADQAAALSLILLAEDYKGHAAVLEGDRRSG